MKVSILKYKNINKIEYIKLFEETDISTPFHSLSFLLSLENAIKEINLHFYVVEKNKKYIAVMPFFKYKNIYFSMKSLVYGCYGGFIYFKENEKDLNYFLKKNRFSTLLTEVVSYRDGEFYNKFSYLSKQELSTWILNIPKTYEEFFQSIHSKTRNQIRKSEKEGVAVSSIDTKEELDTVKLIYKQLIVKHSISKPYDLQLFDELYNQSKKNSTILFKLAKINDNIIAFSIFIMGQEDIFYWINASDSKYLKYNGTNAILDSIIKYAMKNGINELNMGAVPKENSNLLHFKTRWGAIEREYYTYSSKWLMNIQSIRHNKEYQKISNYGLYNYFFNKIGAFTKRMFNRYFDKKIIGNTNLLNKDIKALFSWSTSTQSIDYLYLKYSLQKFKIEPKDNVLDLGSGKGRILCYLNFYYKNIQIFGAEINKEAIKISKELCKEKNISIYNTDALKDDFIVLNKINKIVLFNPFDDKTFLYFIDYINNNVDYYLEFIYINISEEQINILKKSKVKYTIDHIDKRILGINNKVNVIGCING